MKIAYCSCYQGPELCKRCGIEYKPVSSTLKTQGIARALLAAGHEVTIYSQGSNFGHKIIPAFSENIEFQEGMLAVKYPKLYSYPRFTPINDLSLRHYITKELKSKKYDVFIYYNICDNAYLGGYTYLNLFKKQFRILEYEDSIFMKSLVGNKTRRAWLKKLLYKYAVKNTDGIFAVCKGMYDNEPMRFKALTPGVINDDVVDNVSSEVHSIERGRPVRLFLAGGGQYYKGTDLLIQSLKYVDYPCELHFFTEPKYFYDVAKKDVENLPRQHKVVIHDYLPHEELIRVLNREADILMNTTRSFGIAPQSAGFPSKMMEYAALGRPIVSSEIGKLDDEFDSTVTYYEKEDVKSLAQCITDVIENYDEKVRLALELQQIALTKYTIKGTAKRMEDFFEEASECFL